MSPFRGESYLGFNQILKFDVKIISVNEKTFYNLMDVININKLLKFKLGRRDTISKSAFF